MRWGDGLLLAWRALTAQRLRSFLTLLGIAVGIAAVILLTSIGEGIHQYMLEEFSQFGTNVIGVAPGKTRTGGSPTGLPTSVRPLTLDDAKALERLPNVLAVSPVVFGNSEVAANGRVRRTSVRGVGAQMQQVFNTEIRTGQFLPAEEDASNARAFAVLGSKLKYELFGTANPLGARIRIGTMQFRVIGVLESKGQILGLDLDDIVFIPAARAMELYNRDGLMEVHATYAEGTPAQSVSNAITATLKARHGREDFTVTSQEDMLRSLAKILDILTMAVGALGSISLLVGGVGIVTIMTIAVTERTSEIGLLVALGAQPRTILTLFLGEAVALSAVGGTMGLLLGMGLAQAIHLFLPSLPVHTPLEFVFLAEAVSVTIGLLAGVLPARRAAHLNAVDALRSE